MRGASLRRDLRGDAAEYTFESTGGKDAPGVGAPASSWCGCPGKGTQSTLTLLEGSSSCQQNRIASEMGVQLWASPAGDL